MQKVNILPYCTSLGHEFYVATKGNTSIVKCIAATEQEQFNAINPRELKEIIETSKTYGIDKIELHTNYGVNLHSHSLKTNPAYKNLTIVKIIAD